MSKLIKVKVNIKSLYHTLNWSPVGNIYICIFIHYTTIYLLYIFSIPYKASKIINLIIVYIVNLRKNNITKLHCKLKLRKTVERMGIEMEWK